MAEKKLTVLARVKARPGMEERTRRALLALVAPTRKEEGCINYDMHQSQEDKSLFLFYENWTSKAHLDRHLAAAHIRTFFGKAEELLAQPAEITFWERVS